MAKILIADDNEIFRRVVGVHMAAAGHRIIEAATGKAAILAIQSQAPELVLLDYMMPEGDGPTVLRHVRRNGSGSSIPIIMLTARCSGEDKVRAFEDGADDYVVKPFHAGELFHREKRLLSQSRV